MKALTGRTQAYMDRVGLEVESNGLRLQEVGRSLEELAAFKAEATGSLDMIKRELTETAEVMKQEMEQVLATSFATVTEDVVALRQQELLLLLLALCGSEFKETVLRDALPLYTAFTWIKALWARNFLTG